ncbi:MAG: hypothetical protein ACXW1U_18040 [Methylobacter sp.]
MGGIGSGRKGHFDAKETTSDYRRLDIQRWQRDRLLEPGRTFGWQWSHRGETIASINVTTEHHRVILAYRHRRGGGEWKDECYPVAINWTPCHYGGKRAWFLCPARGCGRRVAVLYGGTIFACRHCYRLAYPSQRETPDDRAARRADKIRERLKWEPGILNGNGRKPKGMHWCTYEKLTRQHDAFVDVSLAGIAKRLGILNETLDDAMDR